MNSTAEILPEIYITCQPFIIIHLTLLTVVQEEAKEE